MSIPASVSGSPRRETLSFCLKPSWSPPCSEMGPKKNWQPYNSGGSKGELSQMCDALENVKKLRRVFGGGSGSSSKDSDDDDDGDSHKKLLKKLLDELEKRAKRGDDLQTPKTVLSKLVDKMLAEPSLRLAPPALTAPLRLTIAGELPAHLWRHGALRLLEHGDELLRLRIDGAVRSPPPLTSEPGAAW